MAEYLIYNKYHWIDKLIENNSSTLSTIDLTKFSTRYKWGDIIQVYEDGACTEPPALTSSFVIIKCPGQEIDNKYQEAKIVDKTQKEIDDEWLEKGDEINTIADEMLKRNPDKTRDELLIQITSMFISDKKTTDRRGYYFDMSQINIPQNKVVEITTTQFNNLIKSK